jgi:hypothetical protein
MTGKIQKAKNALEAFKERMTFSEAEKSALIDEAVCEIHAQNAGFLEEHKININVFRGLYINHTLFQQVDALVQKKLDDALAKRVAEYQAEEERRRRRG